MSDVIAGITILVSDRTAANAEINDILSKYAGIIAGRMGIPHLQGERSVISLILQGNETAVDSLVCDLSSIEEAKGIRTVLARFEG